MYTLPVSGRKCKKLTAAFFIVQKERNDARMKIKVLKIEMEYFMNYDNPLEILRDYVLSETTPTYLDVKTAINNAVESEEVPLYYDRVPPNFSGPEMM